MGNDNPVLRSLEIIESHIAEKLTVNNIAESVYFSKYHYMRLFRETVGDSVMEYVKKRKLTLAGRELLETNKCILDIALEFGYDSRDVFTRSFKTYMGVTPSEYRKYGLAAISQNTVKERKTMMYSKTTDEILRELNEFIANSKETATTARKLDTPARLFCAALADKLDDQAERLKELLAEISSIAERSDEITKRFEIVKAIEDVTFNTDILALNARLMAARSLPEHAEALNKLGTGCLGMARSFSMKAMKIADFMNELAALIFADMRKAAAEKVQLAVMAGREASGRIEGYDYIRNEITYLTDALEAKPIEEMTVSWIDDCLFRLRLIASTAELQDVPLNPADKVMFNGIAAFDSSLHEALSFFDSILMENQVPIERGSDKILRDFAYQGNVLLFYLRGETGKLEKFLADGQKAALSNIEDNINNFISFVQSTTDENAYAASASKVYSIRDSMLEQADILGERGGAVRLLAGEFDGLADAITHFIKK